MKIHTITKIIAIIALIEEFAKESSSPSPEIERGPKNNTAIPPPNSISTHITKIKPKTENFKFLPQLSEQ